MIPKTETPYIVGFVLDFETGGLPSSKLTVDKIAITQIALHAFRLDTFEKIGSFVRYIYPYDQKEIKSIAPKRKVLKKKYDEPKSEPMTYSQQALDFTAITMDMLYSQGEDIQKVAEDVLAFMKDVIPAKTPRNMKPVIIGQNITFDEGFLCQMFEYTGLLPELSKIVRGWTDFYGHWHPQMIDTIHLGQLALSHLPNVPSYKLEIMCEMLGIELSDAHDADADVMATANIAAVLTQRMRSIGGETQGGEVHINKTEKSRKHWKI